MKTTLTREKRPEIQIALGLTKRPTIKTGKGLTEQSHKNQTDINWILADYRKTGLLKHAKDNEGRYDDVSPIDFRQAMETVANANSMFETLPANLRKRFDNKPDKFLEFTQNPDNKNELQKLGILKGNDGIDIKGAITNAPVAPQEESQPVVDPLEGQPTG